ncbi:hypothetical protein RRG08_050077 [Elysia crispata]|uniref:Uncharacterized protein n=1 Tax=Elysia crispata TaxID=231223 RepID=A0AAE1AM06_9GAST|nr:hypothetical protein RRG08_050077 [Elysia crispata]
MSHPRQTESYLGIFRSMVPGGFLIILGQSPCDDAQVNEVNLLLYLRPRSKLVPHKAPGSDRVQCLAHYTAPQLCRSASNRRRRLVCRVKAQLATAHALNSWRFHVLFVLDPPWQWLQQPGVSYSARQFCWVRGAEGETGQRRGRLAANNLAGRGEQTRQDRRDRPSVGGARDVVRAAPVQSNRWRNSSKSGVPHVVMTCSKRLDRSSKTLGPLR